MKRSVALCLIAQFLALITPGASRADDSTRKPNIVFILADDLGYGDLGCFGQTKIHTPNLDRLAAQGMRFTQHYAGNAVCAPSRCVLMTGKHPGHAFIRDNRGTPPEGQYPLPAGTVMLPRLLQQLGYTTGGFGKWGLGGPESTGRPLVQGMNRFFGYNCQSVAHNYYPTYLWDDERRAPLDNPEFSAQQKLPPGADPQRPASYASFIGKTYAPDVIAEQALRFVRAHRDRPFFLYFPSTIPHLALQVPDDALAEYRGAFDDPPYPGGRSYLPNFTPRATYAAMVSRLDRHVGQLMQTIADLGLDDDTIFVFSSDNGPLYDHVGGTDCDFFRSAGNFRGRKGSLYEGGLHVPTIVRWRGKVAAGTTSDRVCGFEDWLPTLLELVGGASSIPADIDGVSFVPTLLGRAQPPRPFLYREFPAYGGQQCVRIGDWKGVRQQLMPNADKNKAKQPLPQIKTELYNLRDDPGETHDVADKYPEVVAQIVRIMRKQHTPSSVFPLPPLDSPTK